MFLVRNIFLFNTAYWTDAFAYLAENKRLIREAQSPNVFSVTLEKQVKCIRTEIEPKRE